MQQNPFGNTGLTVSRYGLGTWAMGGGHYGPAEDAESIRTIHRAEEMGCNFIDTAPMYSIAEGRDGRAERLVGEALAGRRDRWIIGTKYGRHLTSLERWKETMREDYSARNAAESLEQSLRRLRTDHVDVLFVHSPPSGGWDPQDAMAGLVKLKEQGKIRVIGFSFWNSIADTLGQVEPFLREGVIGAVQVVLNLLQFEMVRMLLPVLRETKTAVVVREALAAGFLTDSFTADDDFDEQDFKAEWKRPVIREGLESAARFKFLCDPAAGIANLPQAALNYTVSFPEVSTVIPGAKTVAELEQCFAAAETAPFDDATMARIARMQAEIPRFK